MPAFEPLTAITNLVTEGMRRFLPEKMSEAEKTETTNSMIMFMAQQATQAGSDFRNFIVEYEGAAKDIPVLLVWFRSSIRPVFTVLTGYLDFIYFTSNTTDWGDEKVALLKAINIIVLMFWFGERAVANSGIIGILKSKITGTK